MPSLKRSFLLISLKTPSVIYFRNPLSKCNSSEWVSMSFKDDGLAKSAASSLFLLIPQVLYIFEILSAIVNHGLSEKATKYFKEVNLSFAFMPSHGPPQLYFLQ